MTKKDEVVERRGGLLIKKKMEERGRFQCYLAVFKFVTRFV